MATDSSTSSLLRPLADDLRARREQIMLGGGEAKIAGQHAADKLTARERLALLIDEGTFTELGVHGRPHFSQPAMKDKDAPAPYNEMEVSQEEAIRHCVASAGRSLVVLSGGSEVAVWSEVEEVVMVEPTFV